MTEEQFWEAIKKNLDVPINFEDIETVEGGLMGEVYIDMKDGSCYFIMIDKAEYGEDDEKIL